MGIYKIDLNKCDGSPFCPVAQACPAEAVVAVRVGTEERNLASLRYRINPDVCRICGKCLEVCPRKAVYQDV